MTMTPRPPGRARARYRRSRIRRNGRCSFTLVWFLIVAIFWVGFFVLEGFDFGVGMLHTIVGRTDIERRVALNTIGPFWDGNEVWLVVAGAGTFAAFPGWYATMFSALYLALLLTLGRADGARRRVRIQGQEREPPLASYVEVVHDDRQPADPAAARGRAGRSARRAADQPESRFHRQLRRPADPLRHLDRTHARRPVPAARSDLPQTQDDRPGPRARAWPRAATRDGQQSSSSSGT